MSVYEDTVKEYFSIIKSDLHGHKQGQTYFVFIVKITSASLTTHKIIVEKWKEYYAISFLICALHIDIFSASKGKKCQTTTSTTWYILVNVC